MKRRPLLPGWNAYASHQDTQFSAGVDVDELFSARDVACIEVVSGRESGYVHLQQFLDYQLYRGKKIKLTGFVKTEDVSGSGRMWASVSNTKNRVSSTAYFKLALNDTKDWTRFEMVINVRNDAYFVQTGATLCGTGKVWYTVPEVEVLDELGAAKKRKSALPKKDYKYTADRLATKVVLATFKTGVAALPGYGEGTITFPIPGPYRYQVPLTFFVECSPKSALLDYQIQRRRDGTNWIAVVRLKPPKEGAIISWNAVVLISGNAEVRLPKVGRHAPPDVVQWLRSTKCVQSDAREIAEKARKLVDGTWDVETYARKVIAFTSKNRGKGKKFDSLDALTALGAGGSCTSRANLAAALLRAQGVPARTVAHLPVWHRGPLFQHWLVEYWHKDTGWVWAESTLDEIQQPENDVVVVSVSNPDDEDLADDPIHLRHIMPGAAHLSGCELSPEFVPARVRSSRNSAVEQALVSGSDAEMKLLFEVAMENFANIANQCGPSDQSAAKIKSVLAAAQTRSASNLTSVLESFLSGTPSTYHLDTKPEVRAIDEEIRFAPSTVPGGQLSIPFGQ